MASSDPTPACLRWLAAGMVLALASCSILFDADDFRGEGGPGGDGDASQPGEGPDAEPPQPGEFGLVRVEPPEVLEGAGAAWPVPVLVYGQAIAPDVQVELTGPGFDQTLVEEVVVSTDGALAGFPLQVPVLEDLGAGQEEPLTITFRQGGEGKTQMLAIRGLDELLASDTKRGMDTLRQSDLQALYSRIHIDTDVVVDGSAPVRLVATAEIRVDARLSVDGEAAATNTPGAGGPGGCRGGSPGEAGECGDGGGEPGVNGDGGGGGGHRVDGLKGGGDQGGEGGQATGSETLVRLDAEGGNGGGGGGTGADGGGGGGGGGILELTSQGRFIMGLSGFLSAQGGIGGEGICNASLAQGSGGGGSGGAILVRAHGELTDEDTSERTSVRGGPGGPIDPDCQESGGHGAFGRKRVDSDAPGSEVPPFAKGNPDPFRGPVLRAGIPVVTASQEISMEIAGEPGYTFYLDVNGERSGVTMASDGTASAQVTLLAGRNTICVTIGPDTPLSQSEGVQCVSIAYIP